MSEPLLKRWWLGTDGKWRARGETPVTSGSTPVASFAASLQGFVGSFDASSSSDTGSTLVGYAWDFGDGSTGSGKTATHTYAKPGSFTAMLTVTDALNASASTQQTVTIAAGVPVAAFTFTDVYLAVNFDGSSSTDTGATITGWAWKFGDSATATGKTAAHTYSATGSYTATLTVTDSTGQTASVSHTVSVTAQPVNKPPTASFATTVSGATVSVNGSASSDSDGSVKSWAWTWGDSSTGTGVTASHSYATSGTYTVGLKVTDDQGGTGTTSHAVTVTVPAPPPPPPPSGSAGDSGINQTGTAGKQQTGGTQYQSLSGSTLQAKVTAAGAAGVSFPSGKFNMNVFSGSGTSGVSVNYPTGIKALLGAGSASTVLQMPANTDTGHSNASSGTTAIFEHQMSSPADGFVMDGIRFEGTPQGGSGSLLYHVMQIGSIGNATISNCTFTGGKGTSGSPPFETFQLSIWHQAAGKTLLVKNCTFDGKDQTTGALTSAANAATNGAMYGTVTFQDCLFTNSGASAGLALWLQMTGSVVNLVRPVFKNNHRNLGNEAQGGDINIYDPMFYLPTTASEDDIRITWTADANSGHINLHFTAQSNLDAMMSARGGKLLTSQVAAKNATMYGSSHPPYLGPNDPPNFCHIFVAGKEVNRATYWSVPAGK